MAQISNDFLLGVIVLLVGAHYVSMIWEMRRVRSDIASLREQVHALALAGGIAATAAANAATAAANAANAAALRHERS